MKPLQCGNADRTGAGCTGPAMHDVEGEGTFWTGGQNGRRGLPESPNLETMAPGGWGGYISRAGPLKSDPKATLISIAF